MTIPDAGEGLYGESARAAHRAECILREAIQRGASDIHLQCLAGGVLVRLRIDGFLEDHELLPRDLGRRTVNHFKVRAQMNVADRRRPQDGRFDYEMDGRHIDLRTATVDSLYGENLAIRILDRHASVRNLEALGLEPTEQTAVSAMVRAPYGLTLVTGPTGAGKTTTLYAMLERLNSPYRNLVTVEEPIEYDLDRVNQIAVDRRLGLGFPECMRAGFRHDPDVIMVGEIRDRESAEIAVRASLGGHLVLSSLHSGSAFGAFSTLVQHGVSAYMVASSLVGVITQQLVRVICKQCRESLPLRSELLDHVERRDLERALQGVEHPILASGRGCDECRGTGYSGRTGIFEALDVGPAVREALAARASRRRLEELARERGWRTLRQAGFSRIVRGVTTIEEVLRVVPNHTEPETAHDWSPNLEYTA